MLIFFIIILDIFANSAQSFAALKVKNGFPPLFPKRKQSLTER